MRKAFAILVASILFGFTFSSCKSCNKDGSEGNPITDKDNLDNPATDGDESAIVLNDSDLTEVGRYLKSKGASDTEIKAMMDIEKEDFGEGIGKIVHNGDNHFQYVDRNGQQYHEGQTNANCGLYAMKRLLFVLGKRGEVEVSENLWYKHTDQELRDKLANMLKGEKFRFQDEYIDAIYLRTLMRDIEVPIEYCKIYGKNLIEEQDDDFVPFPLNEHDLAEMMAGINKGMEAYAKQAGEALKLVLAQVTMVNVAIEKIENATQQKDKDEAEKEAGEAATVAAQAALDADVAANKANKLMSMIDKNKGYGWWELPEKLTSQADGARIAANNAASEANKKAQVAQDAMVKRLNIK
jgi:hypothetical protein